MPPKPCTSVFRVVKSRAGQPIKAYKRFDTEIGAEMLTGEYLSALVAEMGSPTFVMTKNQLLTRMKEAAANVQNQMQAATIAVAALTVDPVYEY